MREIGTGSKDPRLRHFEADLDVDARMWTGVPESADTPSPRPDFDNPPVIEVALSVGFTPLAQYTSAHGGLFWQRVADKFVKAEEHPPLSIPQESEGVGPAVPRVELTALPTPRLWLVTEDGDELLQLQSDVFARNWRKTAPDRPYARYETVRGQFEKGFRSFIAFTEEQGWETVTPERCDVTYVNHFPAGQGWEKFGELHHLVTTCSWPKRTGFLPLPDEALFSGRFAIRDDLGQFAGRLTVEIKPAFRLDKQRVLVMSMTARGKPLGEGVDGVLAFFDLGREWIVRGFADLTTERMHGLWGRTR